MKSLNWCLLVSSRSFTDHFWPKMGQVFKLKVKVGLWYAMLHGHFLRFTFTLYLTYLRFNLKNGPFSYFRLWLSRSSPEVSVLYIMGHVLPPTCQAMVGRYVTDNLRGRPGRSMSRSMSRSFAMSRSSAMSRSKVKVNVRWQIFTSTLQIIVFFAVPLVFCPTVFQIQIWLHFLTS